MEKFKIIIAHLQSKLVFQEMIIFLALNYIIQMAIPTMILSTYAISVQDVRTSTSVIDYDIAYQDSGLADLDMTSIVSDSNQIGGEPETKLKLEAPEILEKTKENTITKVFKPKVQTSVSSTVKFDVRPEPSSENYRPVLKAKAYIERLEPLPTLKVLSLLSSNTSDFGSEENSSSSDDFLSDYSKVSMDEENVVYFEAVDPKGFIGNGENADSPVDNVFLVHLPENFEENSDYELQYELKGVTKEGVVMTVNSQRTTGGALVEIQESWSQVKHPINLVDLKEGRNYISFTTNKSLDYSYSVKGLRLVPVRNENRVKFDQESISYADSDGLTYLSGFVNDKLQRIQIGQTTLSLTDPDFELLYQLSPTDLSNGFITVNGFDKDGAFTEHLSLAGNLKEDVELLNLNLEREVSTGEISLDGGVIQLSNAAMNVPSNVLDLPKEFSISALGKRDMMPLHSGIVNVTGEHSGFRFLPDGKHFSDKIQIEIPYDDSKFPSGMGLKDVQCFYFDLESRQWRTVPVGEVDTDRKVLIAKTDHFTDYINGIISVPESPSTTEYTPTVMSDIKVADPSAGVNVMRPPSANNSGDATLSYPIVIPPGRKGFQPSVSLNYSSSAGSGWLGYGWSISTPSITVDTRWGAPKFDAQYETELYSLNGEQLLLQPCNNAQDLYRPHRHEEGSASCNFDLLERNGPNAPCTDDTAIFYERRMGSFSKIERIGSTPTEYVWEVTSSDGTRHFYGNPSDDSFEIGSGLGIAKWMLWKVIDKYGNTIVYDYDAIEDELGTKTKLYLKNINYTGHTTGTGNNEQYVPGEFDIQFNLQTNPSATYERKDISINNRSGFKEIDDKLLESIKVVSSISSSVVFVREYVLSYDEGAFSKTRLIELKELDRNGIEFYAHKFDYHNDLGSDPCNLFEPPVLVPIVCDETYPVDCGTIDSDFDGIYDLCDDCPDVFDPSNVCDTPYPCGMNDEDGDGIFDDCDNCPEHYNVGQQDSDNDGVGNACDNCHHYNPDQLNSDGDNFADACDNCPQVINNIQVDSDLDGWGNDCDFCPTIADPFQLDIDGDELGVSCDNCQFTYNPGQADLDGDGIGYACDCENNAICEFDCGDIFDGHIDGSGDGEKTIRRLCTASEPQNYQIDFDPICQTHRMKVKLNGDVKFDTGNMAYDDGCEYGCTEWDLFLNNFTSGNLLVGTGTRSIYNHPIPNPNHPVVHAIRVNLQNVNPQDIVEIEISEPTCTVSSAWYLRINCSDSNPLVSDPVANTKSIGISTDKLIIKDDVSNNKSLQTKALPGCGFLSGSQLLDIPHDGYDREFSALGTTSSRSHSVGLNLVAGIGCLPWAKGRIVTVDGGFTRGWGSSRNKITVVDMNGDGLDDLVKREDKKMVFYAHFIDSNGEHDYADGVVMEFSNSQTIPDLMKSSSRSWNKQIGVTGRFHVGYSRSDTKSNTNIFMTDGNGDGLTDIVVDGVVYFNKIELSSGNVDYPYGKPTFYTSSAVTENMIIKDSNVDVMEFVEEDDDFYDGNYDVVKVWEAPNDGIIEIHKGTLETSIEDVWPTLSIETDNNGIYSYPNGNFNKGTCRLYIGDPDAMPPVINSLPGPDVKLRCSKARYANYPCPDDNYDCWGCNGDDGLGCQDSDVQSLSLNAPFTGLNSTFEVVDTIMGYSNNYISNSSSVTYKAGNAVILEDGFGVDATSSFLGILGPVNPQDNSGGPTPPSGSTAANTNSFTLYVKKGQRVYFRQHVIPDQPNPEISWDPTIKYTSVSGHSVDVDEEDVDGNLLYQSRYSDGFLLSRDELIQLPPGETTVEWPDMELGNMNSDLVFRIVEYRGEFSESEAVALDRDPTNTTDNLGTVKVIWSKVVSRFEEDVTISNPNGILSFPAGGNRVYSTEAEPVAIKFQVYSPTNVDWQAIKWEPVVTTETSNVLAAYDPATSGQATYAYDTQIEQLPIVNYSAYETYKDTFRLTNSPRWNAYNIVRSPFVDGVNIADIHFFGNLEDTYLDQADAQLPADEFISCFDSGPFCNYGWVTAVVSQLGKVVDTRAIRISYDDSPGEHDWDVHYEDETPIRVYFTDEASKDIRVDLVGDGSLNSNNLLRTLEDPNLTFNVFGDDYKIPIAMIHPVGSGEPVKLTRRNVNLLTKSGDLAGHFYRDWGQLMYDQQLDTFPDMAYMDTCNFKLLNTVKQMPVIGLDEAQVSNLQSLSEGDENNPPDPDPLNELDENNFDLDNMKLDNLPASLSGLSAFEEISFLPLFVYPTPKRQKYGEDENGIVLTKNVWEGMHPKSFAARSTGMAGRAEDVVAAFEDEEPIVITLNSSDKGACSLVKRDKSRVRVFNQANVGNWKLSNSNIIQSYNRSLADYMDLNGDRYPDLVQTNQRQLTNATGGLTPVEQSITWGNGESIYDNLPDDNNLGFRNTEGNVNLTFSGGYVVSGEGEDNEASFGLSATYQSDTNNAEVMWMDLNGDGLSDRLEYREFDNIIKTALNQGNGEVPTVDWTDTDLDWVNGDGFSESLSQSFGLGLGYSRWKGNSLSVGWSGGFGWSDAKELMVDMNGDGLVDLLQESNGSTPMTVKYNQGHQFSDPICINLDMNKQSKSDRNSFNLSGTYLLPIPMLFTCIKLGLNAHAVPYGWSNNKTKKSLKDYDGDGYVDFLEQSDSQLYVSYNKTKRTNKLRGVSTPLGAEYVIDYKHTPSTYHKPNGSWVMSELEVRDVTVDDESIEGVASLYKEFEYHNARYDRREREDFGYEYVRVIDRETPGDKTTPVYRQSISRYNNQNYYLKGKLLENHVIRDDNITYGFAPNLQGFETLTMNASDVFTTVIYTYENFKYIYDSVEDIWTRSAAPQSFSTDQGGYDQGGSHGNGAAFPVLMSKETQTLELDSSAPIFSKDEFTYDEFSRVKRVDHTSSNGGLDYRTLILYHPPMMDLNIISIPKHIIVTSNPSISPAENLRYRTVQTLSSLGDPERIRVRYGGTAGYSDTDLTYDNYGNLKTVTQPKINGNEQLVTTYTYDTYLNTYVTEVENEFDANTTFSSLATYDPNYGQMLTSTDVSGNQITYTLDHYGRIETVKGPKEALAGEPYTISNSYPNPVDFYSPAQLDIGDHNNGHTKLFASTQHYDHFNPEDIETITIANGLGEPVQVKKDIYIKGITNRDQDMAISGLVTKDAYGRKLIQYQTSMEEKFNNGQNNLFVPVPYYNNDFFETTFAYDELDRPVSIIDPVKKTTIGYVRNGNVVETTQTSEENPDIINSQGGNMTPQTAVTFTAADGMKIKTTVNTFKTTEFIYDDIGQVELILDGESNQAMTYSYDWAGRVLIKYSEDGGYYQYDYDDRNNLISIINANLEEITYEYDNLNRPVATNFPDYTSSNLGVPATNVDNVQYHYYGTGHGNNTGKLRFLEDATGLTEYTYGEQGEVKSVTRKMYSIDYPIRTFKEEFEYDSWNRIMSMTYADGEKIDYNYDIGGMLTSMTNTSGYAYLQAKEYDHFGQTVFCQFGNGTSQEYTYEPALRRLHNLVAKTGTGGTNTSNGSASTDEMLNMDYQYDWVSNVLHVENTASPIIVDNGEEIGGTYFHKYNYDKFNRLSHPLNGDPQTEGRIVHSTGTYWYFLSGLVYDDMHRIQNKSIYVSQGGQTGQINYDYNYQQGTGASGSNRLESKTSLNNQHKDQQFTYDANGNMTSQTHVGNQTGHYPWNSDDKTLTWSADNKLKGVKIMENMVQHHLYDVSGERSMKQIGAIDDVVTGGGSGVDKIMKFDNLTYYPSGYVAFNPDGVGTKHYFSGSQRIATRLEGNITNYQAGTVPTNPAGGITGTVTERQIAELEQLAEDLSLDGYDIDVQGVNQSPPAAVYFYHPDHLGSSTFISDASGDPYEFILYMPFGGELFSDKISTPDWSTDYKFTGQEEDASTGLYYYGARYYDPGMSQFLSVDPLADTPDNISFSPYSYVANNPIMFTDPTGMTREGKESNGMGLRIDGIESNGMGLTLDETQQKRDLSEPLTPVLDLGSETLINDMFEFFKELDNRETQFYKEGEEDSDVDWPYLATNCIDYTCVKNNFKYSSGKGGTGWMYKTSDYSILLSDESFLNMHSLSIQGTQAQTRSEMGGRANIITLQANSNTLSRGHPIITVKIKSNSEFKKWTEALGLQVKKRR